MRTPDQHDNASASAFEPFLLGAKHSTLEPACSALLVSGRDLAWGTPSAGAFLIDADVDEDVAEAIEADKVRGELALFKLLGLFAPTLEHVMAPVIAEAERARAEGRNEAGIAGALAAERMRGPMGARLNGELPQLIGAMPTLAAWLGSAIAKSSLEFRERQVRSCGFDLERYDDMIEGLRRLDLVEPVVRVVVAEGGLSSELSLPGAEGFIATDVQEGAQSIEVLRLKPWLAAAKRADRDCALPLFMAQYLNAQSVNTVAFACAKFEHVPGDIDVLLPSIALGIEVKLIHAPATADDEKIEHLLRKFATEQMPRYREAGCERVVVVTNAPAHPVEQAYQRLKNATPSVALPDLVVAGGMAEVIEFLDGVLTDVRGAFMSALERRVEAEKRRLGEPSRIVVTAGAAASDDRAARSADRANNGA